MIMTSVRECMLFMYKSPKFETWLELGPSHPFSCNDLTTICFKLQGQIRAPTQGLEISMCDRQFNNIDPCN